MGPELHRRPGWNRYQSLEVQFLESYRYSEGVLLAYQDLENRLTARMDTLTKQYRGLAPSR
jgi:hypothetical protein